MSAAPAEPTRRRASRGLIGLTEHDSSAVQVVTSAAIIVVCALSIEPRGWTGSGVVTLSLVVINSILLATRHLPESVVPTSSRVVLLYSGAAASSALVALATRGTPYLFAFFVAGHAGFRLAADRAVPIAVMCSVLSGGVLLLHVGPGHQHTPWGVGAAAGFSVLLGMISRSRQAAMTSALAAAEAAERAARAEASEAVLAERGRIARDVHDVLAHSLAGINMQLELADALLDVGDVERVREATRRAQSLVRESLIESQRTVRALREDTLPLVDTLRAMLDSSTISGHVEVEGSPRDLDTRVSQNLVRIAQEALTNAARHAPGAPVVLTVTYEPDTITLAVVNGLGPSGPSEAAGLGSGMGLVGMRERAALLGGTVTAGVETDGIHRGGWHVRAIVAS